MVSSVFVEINSLHGFEVRIEGEGITISDARSIAREAIEELVGRKVRLHMICNNDPLIPKDIVCTGFFRTKKALPVDIE